MFEHFLVWQFAVDIQQVDLLPIGTTLGHRIGQLGAIFAIRLAYQGHCAIFGEIVGVEQQARLAVQAKLQEERGLILQAIIFGEEITFTNLVDVLIFGEIP